MAAKLVKHAFFIYKMADTISISSDRRVTITFHHNYSREQKYYRKSKKTLKTYVKFCKTDNLISL